MRKIALLRMNTQQMSFNNGAVIGCCIAFVLGNAAFINPSFDSSFLRSRFAFPFGTIIRIVHGNLESAMKMGWSSSFFFLCFVMN